MITSQNFRTQNNILFSAPILTKVKVEEDYSAGWGDPCSTGEIDVIDLNGNGQADPRPTSDRYNRDSPKVVYVEEPSLHAPAYEALQGYAQKKGAEVLTAADLPGGVFICNSKAEQLDDKQIERSNESVRSLDVLVAERFDPQYPDARWALDLAQNQMLIYVPNPA